MLFSNGYKNAMKIQIKYDGKTRTIGDIQGGVFYTQRKASIHKFRKTNSWGIDHEVLTTMLIGRIKLICITDIETRTDYWITPEQFKENGVFYNFKNHRLQMFVTENKFHKTAKQATDWWKQRAEPKEIQTNLFDKTRKDER